MTATNLDRACTRRICGDSRTKVRCRWPSIVRQSRLLRLALAKRWPHALALAEANAKLPRRQMTEFFGKG